MIYCKANVLLNFSRVAPSEAGASVTKSSRVRSSRQDSTLPEPEPTAPKNEGTKISNLDKEKKIFISLSYIIIAYLLCWSPFHIVFDILYFDENAVSFEWYSFATLCCYLNSTLNPFLYACASKDFRTAFKNILFLKHCKRTQ